MIIKFVTPTILSLIDLTTMGDSSKRNDPTTIGQFDSGLKYAIALLLRAGVEIEIEVYADTDCPVRYIPSCKTITRDGKSKEVIQYKEYWRDDDDEAWSYDETHITAFAKQLGYNWELWMAFRELYSNMVDEGGNLVENESDWVVNHGTVITLRWNGFNQFAKVWQNKDVYVNSTIPMFKTKNVEFLSNPLGYLRIYKQNVLVYKDENVQSHFAFNINFGNIDERRILLDISDVQDAIIRSIAITEDEAFLRYVINPNFTANSTDFLNKEMSYVSPATDLVSNVVHSVGSDVNTFRWILESVRKRKDCVLPGRTLNTLDDHLWSASKKITLESVPEVITPVQHHDFIELINKHYNFPLNDIEVRVAVMKGGKVAADKFNKCLFISDKFDIEKDFPEFIQQYVDLTTKGNIVHNLCSMICDLIKK